MTMPLSILIAWPGAAADLLRLLAELLGQTLVLEELDTGPVHSGKLLDTEVVLISDHGLEDDSGIEFSLYSHQLQLVALNSGRSMSNYDRLYQGLALFLAQRLSAQGQCRTEVVSNLQKSIAKFG